MQHAEASSARQHAFLVLKIAVSIALMVWLFSRIDVAKLWASARLASVPWLAVALVVYAVNVIASVGRWHLLLGTQGVHVSRRTMLGSFLVALFFNNFLPSNIGGDVIRIRDTSRPARSKTLATMVVLGDRVIGLIGLVLVAALGATIAAGRVGRGPAPILPIWLWAGFVGATLASAPAVLVPAGVGRLLRPLTVIHPEWVGDRIDVLTATLTRFQRHPSALFSCFGGAVFVQATVVVFYAAVAHALHITISPWDLAVIVPLSFIVQLLPVSMNGFGVREATFTFYFTRVGQSIESALLLSLAATALAMVFSLSGAAVYVARGRH